VEARNPQLMMADETEHAVHYLLSDANDATDCSGIQHFDNTTINVCMTS